MDKLGINLVTLANKCCAENRKIEIEKTMAIEGEECQMTVEQKKDNRLKINKKATGITVSLDMGWQKRAAGHSYNSLSRCIYMVGLYSGLILFNLVFCMCCAQCLKALKQGLSAPKHRCSKKYEGSSKGMEAKAVVQLVTKYYTLMKNSFIRQIVSDDDSTMRAAM